MLNQKKKRRNLQKIRRKKVFARKVKAPLLLRAKVIGLLQ
jgi:hypothetical protein